jgi:AcrR family transcriptional regulator
MAQRPKVEVRAALLAAAAQAFAEGGFERAALSDIVLRAGTSIGNLYKYFANKDELFAEFIPRGFAADLKQCIRVQVQALQTEPDAFCLDAGHPYRRASEDLLRFTIAHRERVVFLLLRAQGTKHERVAGEIVRLLVDLALEYAQATYPDISLEPANKRALARIYRSFVATLASILTEERTEQALREAVALQTTYHLSGLKAFFLGARPTVIAKEASR